MIRGVSIYKPKARSRKTDPWLVAYGPRGNRKTVSGSTDKNITIELASKLARTLERVKAGIASPDELRYEEQAVRPVLTHLDDYERALIDQGRTAKHAKQMRTYAQAILTGAGVRFINDMVTSLIQREIAKVEHKAATKNRHVAAVRAFLAWGVVDVRWPKALAESVRLTTLKSNVERARRVLALDELTKLIQAAESGIVAENVAGPVRALIYRLVVASGLRANELRSLRVTDLRDNGISVLGKNGKRTIVYLPASLMAELHRQADGRDNSAALFPVAENLHRMIKADLKAAGLDYTTPAGTFDFHALRHQCGSMLAAAGLPVKAVQAHMRHASARMTMDVYGHLFDADRDRSVGVIEKIGQHLAQRTGVVESVSELPKVVESPGETEQNQVERRGIEPRFAECDSAAQYPIYLISGRLHQPDGSPLAPGAAPALLAHTFRRVIRRKPRTFRRPSCP